MEVELREKLNIHRVRVIVQKHHLFRSAHIAEEHLFLIFPSIFTFDFDLIYRLFFLGFLGPNGLFCWLEFY